MNDRASPACCSRASAISSLDFPCSPSFIPRRTSPVMPWDTDRESITRTSKLLRATPVTADEYVPLNSEASATVMPCSYSSASRSYRSANFPADGCDVFGKSSDVRIISYNSPGWRSTPSTNDLSPKWTFSGTTYRSGCPASSGGICAVLSTIHASGFFFIPIPPFLPLITITIIASFCAKKTEN